MDSVTKDTPKKLNMNENIKNLRVDEIFIRRAWYQDNNVITQWRNKEFGVCEGKQIWTSEGWKKLLKIFRHKTERDIYRIGTNMKLLMLQKSKFNR